VGVDSAVSPAAPGLVVAMGSTGCVVGGPVAKTRMSGSSKSTATAMTGPSRFRFVGRRRATQRQRVFVAGPDEHDDDGAVVPRLQETPSLAGELGVDERGEIEYGELPAAYYPLPQRIST